nr:MAG TPA: tail connector protein [Caudoviricetes sp.]
MNEELKQRAIKKLQADLPGTAVSKLEEMIERAVEYFLWVTNRKVVPKLAFYLLVDMAKSLDNITVSSEEVKSVKAGDTTVEFGDSKDSYDVLKKFKASLNVYKKVKML